MVKYLKVGVDIGGTSIKIGFIKKGKIIDKWEIPTNKQNRGTFIVNEIWESIKNMTVKLNINKQDIRGIGIGAPGFVDSKAGIVYKAVNIGWQNKEFARQFRELSGLPIFIENDANLAALGENWKGAGNSALDLLAITLGTGIGGGIITNGSLVNGVNGLAGEIGHITIDPSGYLCNCGRRGCLETIASATGIVKQAKDIIPKHPQSKLANYYKRNSIITAKEIFNLAEKGDLICTKIIQHTAEILGMVLANLAIIINPSKIIIGGGVANTGEKFLVLINASFKKHALISVVNDCELMLAKLGNDAGIIGAPFLVKQKLQHVNL